jgi:hypothetical protein
MPSQTLARVIRAREALQDGDVGLAEQVLGDLETELTPARRRCRCETCSVSFLWPGELQRHQDVSGHDWEAP